MNTKKQTFNFTDYIFRKAFSSNTTDRGRYENDIMESYTSKDSNSHLIAPFSMRALTSGTDTAGGSTVAASAGQSPTFGGLYDDSFFLSQGTVLDNLQSTIKIDSKSAGILTSTAVGETEANTFSTEPQFENLVLEPHYIRVSIKLSNTLIETSSKGVSDLILNDCKRALSQELDRQVLRGTGASGEITGISSTTGISSDTWGNLGVLDGSTAHEKIIDAESNLAYYKIPKPYNFLMNAATRKQLRRLRFTNFNSPIFTDESKVIGYDAEITENLLDASCYALNPRFSVIALWHPISEFDLLIDRYSVSNENSTILNLSVVADASLAKVRSLSIITES